MGTKMGGYAGQILRINLSTQEISKEATDSYANRFLGGEGINQWILFHDVRPGVWPLDPANEIIVGTGALTGTAVPTACRGNLTSKNVVTGGVATSCFGGHFGPELKFAGYDHLIVKGRSRRPCYIWIDNSQVEVRDAEHLWGKTTWETEDAIKDEHGDRDVQLLTIGPAGENLVRAANVITCSGDAAARCGFGAVMGSKNLKAIAVRGKGELRVANTKEFMRLAKDLLARMKGSYGLRRLRQEGTFLDLEALNEIDMNVVRNFQDTHWEYHHTQRTSQGKRKEYLVRNLSCFGCPVGCKKYLRVSQGQYAGAEGQGFEHGAAISLMTKLDVDELPAVIKMNLMCNQLGLDVDNTGGPIAWAMECYEKGILTSRDTGGLELEWGDYETAIELIRMIAYRHGFGDLLAEGSWRASQIVGRGSDKYAMHIKGQDLEEPLIGKIGFGFGAIISCIGGGHLRGSPVCEGNIGPEEGERLYGLRTAGDRTGYEGKGILVARTETFKNVVDIMGTCVFMSQRNEPQGIGMEDYASLYTAASGRKITSSDLERIGESVVNVQKAFNIREGFRRKDDHPPARFLTSVGSRKNLDARKLEALKDEYYAIRGWDIETSVPSEEKLQALDLPEVAEQLAQLKK